MHKNIPAETASTCRRPRDVRHADKTFPWRPSADGRHPHSKGDKIFILLLHPHCWHEWFLEKSVDGASAPLPRRGLPNVLRRPEDRPPPSSHLYSLVVTDRCHGRSAENSTNKLYTASLITCSHLMPFGVAPLFRLSTSAK